MKKYCMFLIVASTLASSSFAQNRNREEQEEKEEKKEKKERLNVPPLVLQSFTKKYPGTSAKWEKEGDNYEAGFKHYKQPTSVLFEPNGTMIESEVEINVNELPAPIIAYIRTNYTSSKLTGAARISKPNGEINYEAALKRMDLFFDANGKYLSLKKD